MKIFHISDLHIGKQLHYYNLREEQEDMLEKIILAAEAHEPDVMVIAGDIYDKSAPSAEAYEIFNQFLNRLTRLPKPMPVLLIAGNHDNASRLSYASAFLEKSRIYISAKAPGQEEYLKKITVQDAYGDVNFYLLPFIRPRDVRQLFEEGVVTSYDTAVAAVLNRETIDDTKRNVLVAHQFFVAGTAEPERCDSEQNYIAVGGIDSVDICHVQNFDYVALGHIHGAQKMGAEHIRYSGTPLKYSVSEARHQKGITMVTLQEKGVPLQIEQLPLTPLHDVRKLEGTLEELLHLDHAPLEDYVSITLKDEDGLYRPKDQLEERYRRILEVRLDNTRIRHKLAHTMSSEEHLTPFEAFQAFYQEMNGQPMSEEEARVIADVIETAKEMV
ncbi:MAG: exonuclease SbcCD subunit D [Peptococcaceae bacterium]|nr:exonuclease SbcCD subunit D [Peptococcaceae bacterium]